MKQVHTRQIWGYIQSLKTQNLPRHTYSHVTGKKVTVGATRVTSKENRERERKTHIQAEGKIVPIS